MIFSKNCWKGAFPAIALLLPSCLSFYSASCSSSISVLKTSRLSGFCIRFSQSTIGLFWYLTQIWHLSQFSSQINIQTLLLSCCNIGFLVLSICSALAWGDRRVVRNCSFFILFFFSSFCYALTTSFYFPEIFVLLDSHNGFSSQIFIATVKYKPDKHINFDCFIILFQLLAAWSYACLLGHKSH